MAPRLIATDLDGTIVRRDGTVSERTRAALARAQAHGALVVLVSGRAPRWMDEVAELTGHTGLAVCANGAMIYDLGSGRIVESQSIDSATLMAVADRLAAAVPGLAFGVEYGSAFARESAYRHSHPIGDDRHVVAPYPKLLGRPAVKLLARADHVPAEELAAVAMGLVGDRVTITYSSSTSLLEMSPAGVTKATGLVRIAELHDIDPADAVAFGDMPNDLPMLAWAGQAVAVGNAHPEVLAMADLVSGSVDEDGVAAVLEAILPVDTRQMSANA